MISRSFLNKRRKLHGIEYFRVSTYRKKKEEASPKRVDIALLNHEPIEPDHIDAYLGFGRVVFQFLLQNRVDNDTTRH